MIKKYTVSLILLGILAFTLFSSYVPNIRTNNSLVKLMDKNQVMVFATPTFTEAEISYIMESEDITDYTFYSGSSLVKWENIDEGFQVQSKIQLPVEMIQNLKLVEGDYPKDSSEIVVNKAMTSEIKEYFAVDTVIGEKLGDYTITGVYNEDFGYDETKQVPREMGRSLIAGHEPKLETRYENSIITILPDAQNISKQEADRLNTEYLFNGGNDFYEYEEVYNTELYDELGVDDCDVEDYETYVYGMCDLDTYKLIDNGYDVLFDPSSDSPSNLDSSLVIFTLEDINRFDKVADDILDISSESDAYYYNDRFFATKKGGLVNEKTKSLLKADSMIILLGTASLSTLVLVLRDNKYKKRKNK